MEVSNYDDVASATISKSKGTSASIDDSPEFFNILSSSLYKHQHLAVVRETITNAWDAHIEAGITTPIKVWFDEDNYLHIRDFGKGIPHELLSQVYITYGKGTKRNDSAQTGGFGLGCKSPWAYVDSFDVVNHHNGIKSISTMAKSSSRFEGKPGLIPVVENVPTTETGVEVVIEIKEQDLTIFIRLIESIVYTGDIPCIYEDTLLPTLGMPFIAGEVRFVPSSNNCYSALPHVSRDGGINIRYGNVIYPLARLGIRPDTGNEAYNYVVDELLTVLQDINRNHTQYISMIIQIPSDSVSLMPSREGISETDFSLNNLATYLNDALGKWIRDYNQGKERAIGKAINAFYLTPIKTALVMDIKNIFNSGRQSTDVTNMQSFFDMGMLIGVGKGIGTDQKQSMLSTKFLQWAKNHLKLSITELNMLRHIVREGIIGLNLYAMGESSSLIDVRVSWYDLRDYTKGSYQKLMYKLLKKAVPKELAALEELRVTVNDDAIKYSDFLKISFGHGATTRNPIDCLKLLTNTKPVVVLSTNKRTYAERLSARGISSHYTWCVQMSSPKKAAKEAMRAKLASMDGITFVDLTEWTDADIHLKPEPRKYVSVSKRAGKVVQKIDEYVTLANLIDGDGDICPLSHLRYMMITPTTTDSPEYVCKVTSKTVKSELGISNSTISNIAIKDYGSKVAVVNNEGTYQRLLREGIKPFSDLKTVVVDKIISDSQAVAKTITPKYNNSTQMLSVMVNTLLGRYLSREDAVKYGITEDERTELYHCDNKTQLTSILEYCIKYCPRVLPVRFNETKIDESKVSDTASLVKQAMYCATDEQKLVLVELHNTLTELKPSRAIIEFLVALASYENWCLLSGISSRNKDELVIKLIQVLFKDFKDKQ